MEKQVARVETVIDAAPDTVWHDIVNASNALMPGTTVESDWQVGSPITFTGEFNGKPFKDYGEITERQDGRAVAFSHWSTTPKRPEDYHIVRYELVADGERTRVVLTQTNVGNTVDVDEKTAAEFTRNWQMMLEHLKKSAEKAN